MEPLYTFAIVLPIIGWVMVLLTLACDPKPQADAAPGSARVRRQRPQLRSHRDRRDRHLRQARWGRF